MRLILIGCEYSGGSTMAKSHRRVAPPGARRYRCTHPRSLGLPVHRRSGPFDMLPFGPRRHRP